VNRLVHVHGGGVAAAACHALLHRFGWLTSGDPPSPPAVPFVAIDSVSCQLVADIVGAVPRGHVAAKRLTVYHETADVFSVDEPRLVINAAHLLLQDAVDEGEPGDAAWRIYTLAGPNPGPILTSGRRTAWLVAAEPRVRSAAETCIFEFTRDGWAFWVPTGLRCGLVQFALPAQGNRAECDAIFANTRILRKWISIAGTQSASIPCAALAYSELVNGASISCGGAALRFDPISGDGTGASLRSAILACAVLRYASAAADPKQALDHYRFRIGLAFRGHLRICERLYEEAGLSIHWQAERAGIRRAIEESKRVFGDADALRFRLQDYALAAAS
jgi:hypothetical protein